MDFVLPGAGLGKKIAMLDSSAYSILGSHIGPAHPLYFTNTPPREVFSFLKAYIYIYMSVHCDARIPELL